MIPLSKYKNKTIAVLGLGKTGRAAADALHAAGTKLLLWDDKQSNCETLPVGYAAMVQHYDDWDWSQIVAIVLSPGIPFTHPKPHAVVQSAKAHNVGIISDIELLYEAQPDAIYVAITGTNGKSTTTALIGHILQQSGRNVQVGGNIGTPALAMQPLAGGGFYVLELSSYQLDLLHSTKFDVAIWLNISPDHLDRHGSIDGYVAAKKNIFARQTKNDTAIIGVDDAYSEAVYNEITAPRAVPISVVRELSNGCWVKGDLLHDRATRNNANLSDCESLQGKHNQQNAAAAYAACIAVGVPHEDIVAAMKSFGGLEHRMQKVGAIGDVIFVNDSKATNADAAAKSLGTYEDIYWIAGGVAKAGGIEPLVEFFPRIKHAFLIGEAKEEFSKTLGDNVTHSSYESLVEAICAAYAAAKVEGGVVLLAPACASFDQFSSFEKRGECFVKTVMEMIDA